MKYCAENGKKIQSVSNYYKQINDSNKKLDNNDSNKNIKCNSLLDMTPDTVPVSNQCLLFLSDYCKKNKKSKKKYCVYETKLKCDICNDKLYNSYKSVPNTDPCYNPLVQKCDIDSRAKTTRFCIEYKQSLIDNSKDKKRKINKKTINISGCKCSYSDEVNTSTMYKIMNIVIITVIAYIYLKYSDYIVLYLHQ